MSNKKEQKNEEKLEEENKEEKIEEIEKIEIKNKEQNVQKSNSDETQKSIIKVEEPKKPTLLEQNEEKNKKNVALAVSFFVIVLILLFFSVVFAFFNATKSVIINGITVKNIDVSNLNIPEAKAKIEKNLNIELNSELLIKSNDYEITLNPEQIEFVYDISSATEKAYSIGREGNIFQNNFKILKCAIYGQEVNIEYSFNKDSLDYIVNDIESKLPGLVEEASFYRENSELIIIPGKDGIAVNKEKLKDEIISSIYNLDANELKNSGNKIIINIPIEQAKAKDIDIESIYKSVYTEPQNAYYEEEPFKVYAEVEGVDFAISKEEAKAIVLQKQDEYRIPLKLTPAEKTINDIGLEAFPYLISEFTTKYDASNKNRSQNLAIAAGKIDGTVLMPGEEFSFNKVVGKRTIQEGYKDAKIYANGQVVDGLAGGICQISSTLYNAVIKANLEVTERRNHSFTTSYIKAGQDATVVYGVIDFKFKNTRTYPIKISASVNSGIAEFKINGIKEDVEYDVSLYPVTTATIPYSTQYIPDATLAPGQHVSVQHGGNGLKVTTYKDTKLDGKLISRELVSTDTYQPMNAIVRVGP